MTSLVNKFRASRFRQTAAAAAADVEVEVLLPPPLPLIQLPEQSPLARSGALNGRPMHLPVRRHLHAEQRNFSPEPILCESRLLLDAQADEEDARVVTERLCVYEYNQPQVFQNCGAPDDTLIFDSLFESGNLQCADRVFRAGGSAAKHEYELVVHPDLKNSAYRQWFYFEVRNVRRGVVVKFSLVNLAKSGALFGYGLQPCVYSEIDADTRQRGWVHAGTHVRYAESTSPNAPPGTNALSFQFEFAHDNDRVYFACLQPYTYTDLIEYLDRLEHDPQRSAFVRRTELCQTIAQNACDLLSITAPATSKESLAPEDKKLIVVSARVHPGEPNASWMMQGMLDYLTGASSGAAVLRNHFVFKVVPMLNPDGVVNGNTRVNLAGWDLNRKWSSPVEKFFPTVFHLKKQLATWQTRDRVAIYCDLHGHSINRNIFTYGCCNKRANKKQNAAMNAAVHAATAATTDHNDSNSSGAHAQPSVKNDPRVFPMIVAKNSEVFSFASCDFKVHKSKLNTARVVVNHELGVTNSYTLEASFCGPDFGARKDTQFSTWDLEDMGRTWCQSLLIYFGLLPQVRALDRSRDEEARRRRLETASPRTAVAAESASSSTLDELIIATPDDALLELSTDILSDCEAAISELFASVDLVEETLAPRRDSCDSDLSDAEDAIPPNNGPEDTAPKLVPKPPLVNGFASAPEEYSQGGGKAIAKRTKCRASARRNSKSASGAKKPPSKKKNSKSRQRIEDHEAPPGAETDAAANRGDVQADGDEKGGGSDSDKPARRTKSKRSRRRRKETPKSFRQSAKKCELLGGEPAKVESGRLADLVLPDVPWSSTGSRPPKMSVFSEPRQDGGDEAYWRHCDAFPFDSSDVRSGSRRRSKLARFVVAEPLELPSVVPRHQQHKEPLVLSEDLPKQKPSRHQQRELLENGCGDHDENGEKDSGRGRSRCNSAPGSGASDL